MHKWVAANVFLKPAYALLGERVAAFRAQFEETQWLSRRELREHQLARLQAQLRYAQEHVPYYRRRMIEAGIGPAALNDPDVLTLLPALSKEDIRTHSETLKSGVTHFRKASRKTSGSTGQPLPLQKDRTATAAMNAVMWRNYRWFGIDVGDRQVRVWAGPVTRLQRWKMHLADRLQNRIRLSSFVMTPPGCERFTRQILQFKPQYVYGYGQSLYRLAAYIRENGIDLKPMHVKAVLTTAEVIFDQQRAAIQDAFHAPVVDEYGCSEAGIIAMTCPAGRLHVSENLLVEVVRDGRPVPPGEEGEILITELYAALMPLIRYRVGDRGVLSTTTCACGRGLPVLERFTGRTTDYISCPDGTVLDPYVIEFFLKARPDFFKAVRQWNIRQVGQSKVLITLCSWTTRPDIACYLREMFLAVSRQQLDIEVAYADWLQAEPSGKTRAFSS